MTAVSQQGSDADNNDEDRFLNLTISSKGLPEERNGDKILRFSDVCASFAANLVKNKGLWATGPFSRFTCIDEASQSKNQGAKSSPWKLVISSKNDVRNFLLTYNDSQTSEPLTILNYDIVADAGPLSLLSKKDFGSLVAFYISSAMPFRSAIPAHILTKGSKLAGRIEALKNLNPPDELQLFDIDFRRGVWIPRSLGVASLKGDSGGKVIWITPPVTGAVKHGYVFLQQVEAREEVLRRSDQMIKDLSSSFLGSLLNLGKSAYVGVRYGVPFGGQGVMKAASMLGVFADLRSGIASGIKINYDVIAEKTAVANQGKETFSWSRGQFGYSIIKNVDWFIISRIDATPKLGVTSLFYHYVPDDESGFSETKYSMTRAPTVGFELGMEKNTKLARVRAWSFGSFSVGILPLDKNHSTTSLRVGLDAYRDLFKLGRVSLAILGFSNYEQTKILKKSTATEIDAGDSAQKELTLRSLYAGGGVTLTW
jgi:hypothetical protein